MVQRFKYAPILLVVLIAVTGCGQAATPQANATPTPIPTPIVPSKPTYEVKRGQVVKLAQFTGRIAPVLEEDLFFRTGGYVDRVYVERDQWVEQGDLLAELEVTDLKNQLTQAETDLQAMQQDYDRRLAEAEAALDSAQVRLAQKRIADPAPDVEIAKVSLEQAQLGLSDAEEEYDKALHRTWEPDKVLDAYARQVQQAEWNLRVAQARYDQALQAQEAYAYDLQLLAQEVDLARLRLEEVETGLDLQQAELQVQRLQDLLDDARITAPFDGQLLSVSLSEGREVAGYDEVMVIANMDELDISADLSADVMEDLVEGMAVTIEPNSRPGEIFEGQIRQLPYPYGGGGQTADEAEDETTRITMDVDIQTEGLEIGDLMRLTVILEQKDDVLWLPPQAIRTFEGREFVVVQEDEAQRRVDVTLGIESEDRVEIEEGLTEGQTIIGQ